MKPLLSPLASRFLFGMILSVVVLWALFIGIPYALSGVLT